MRYPLVTTCYNKSRQSEENHGRIAPLSPVPLYSQLKELLRERILDGTYPPHSRMPSEAELGKAFDVSRITVRQALGDLQKEGLIFKIHGKGTFVAKPKAFQNVTTLQGLGESMSQMGYEVINRLRSFRHVPASALVAERLQVAEGSLVTEIRRVRLINREPVSLELTWLPKAVGEKLEKADRSPATSSCCWKTTVASPWATPTWPSMQCWPMPT